VTKSKTSGKIFIFGKKTLLWHFWGKTAKLARKDRKFVSLLNKIKSKSKLASCLA